MHRVKKLALIFISLVFLMGSICQTASATELSPHASLYLDSYGAGLYQGDREGSILIDFIVCATEISDRVGISKLVIFTTNNEHVATFYGSVANGLLCEDKRVYSSEFTYFGCTPGVSYYAVLTMYAERDGGYDTRVYTTNNCVAP